MAYLEPGIDAARAQSALAKPNGIERLSRLFRWRRTPTRDPHLEAIWFPFYLITLYVTSRKGPGTMATAVEAWSGSFSLIEGTPDPVDGSPPGDWFDPKLSEDAAETIARRDLLRTVLAQRSYGPKPRIVRTECITLLQWPLYVYYYERRPGFVDVRVLDGIAGERVGAKMKTGVLEAFSERARTAQPQS